MAVEVSYSQSDFKQAFAALLPPGQYWQYEPNSELDKLLDGIGSELKTIHDQTKINDPYVADSNNLGWKIADYQNLLDENQTSGTIYDDSATPNLIYVDIDSNQAAGALMQTLDSYRLPHTAFCFIYNNKTALYISIVRSSLQMNTQTMTTVTSAPLTGLAFGLYQIGAMALGNRDLQIDYQPVITILRPAFGQRAIGATTLGI